MADSTKVDGGAEIYVNKLEAARRQIDAAIRMLLASEDSLAIQTVTAAGFGILQNLLEHRGKYDLEELLKAGIYQSAVEYAEGRFTRDQLDGYYKGDIFTQDLIIRIAKDVEEGKLSSPDETNVEIAIGDAGRKERHDKMAKIPNFLKHADNDQHGVLNLSKVDNIELLSHAASAFFALKKELTDEMRVILFLQRASHIEKFGYPGNKVEEHLASLTASERLAAGKKLLDIFRAEG
jgi:hypothetical protein